MIQNRVMDPPPDLQAEAERLFAEWDAAFKDENDPGYIPWFEYLEAHYSKKGKAYLRNQERINAKNKDVLI